MKSKIEELKVDKWINIKDKLPDLNNKIVWGYWKNREVCLVEYLGENTWYSFEHDKLGDLDYWMPLQSPLPPKEEDK
jgi:hypothetical protein